MELYEQNNRRLRRRFRVQNYTLTELIKPNILQQIQDAFSEYSGMASITTDAEGVPVTAGSNFTHRSEERRVGKECRSRWSPYH